MIMIIINKVYILYNYHKATAIKLNGGCLFYTKI